MRTTFVFAAFVSASLIATSAMAGVTYTYDALGRLSVAAYDNKQITYTYDPAGNRTLVATTATSPHFGAVQHTSAKAKKSRPKHKLKT